MDPNLHFGPRDKVALVDRQTYGLLSECWSHMNFKDLSKEDRSFVVAQQNKSPLVGWMTTHSPKTRAKIMRIWDKLALMAEYDEGQLG